VSSSLLQVECTTVLRRLPRGGMSEEDRREAERRLGGALEEVTIKPVDEEIAALVRDTPGLSGCRALDAAHLATALYFRDAGDPELVLCTFDARMAKIADRVGLRVEA
jgi:predicted nucleic acid-binding protein